MENSLMKLSTVVVRVVLFAVLGVGVSSGVAMAAAPLAGTVISNQAAATYTDGSSIQRIATSNTVTTIVQQVSALTLTANQTQTAGVGAPVNFPHTLTNTGNGPDSYNLTATPVATGVLSTPTYYIDANCDGVADNGTAITSINNVAAGAAVCFVATTAVSGTAAAGSTGTISVTATSTLAGAVVSASNTDTVTVTAQAVINVTKAISVSSGAPGARVTFTLTYTNTGNVAATNVVLADFLPTGVAPAGMTYVAGSALLNGVAVSDALDADAFDYNGSVANRLTAIIPTVAANSSGRLVFDATVNVGTPPGTLINQARYCFNDGGAVIQPVTSCTTPNTATSPTAGSGTPTNPTSFTVLQTGAVATNASPTDMTIGGGAAGDVVTIGSATQGATVTFNDYVHNPGNGTDTYNVVLSGSTFPAGTTFLLFKSDGVTPLTDTNAIPDGVVDTGPVVGGGSYLVVVKAMLPAGVSGTNAGYTNVLTATSTFDPTKSDPVTNKLTTITANQVDLTNGAPALPAGVGQATVAQGLGAGPSTPTGAYVGGVYSATSSVNPGASATFPLFITNTSGVPDNYGLSATALPTGWTIAYFVDGGVGNCSTLGAVFTNTGMLAPAANQLVCAVVTTIPTATPGANPITFTVLSPSSGASDTKAEVVTVNTVRSITLTPPNAGQVFPGGSIVYSHTLTNNGNVIEGSAAGASPTSAVSTITLTDPMTGATAGWANIVYWDSNNNGILDATDLVVTGVALNTVAGFTGLTPGASIRLFTKVFSSAGAVMGDVNSATLTATTSGIVVPVTALDITTVIAGKVDLFKTQALDANCDGIADTAFSAAAIGTTPTPNAGAIPGACLMYRITATNNGVALVSSVVVSDATPANTTYFATPAAATTLGTIAAPGNGAVGTVSATLGTLNPAQAATISFSVKINP